MNTQVQEETLPAVDRAAEELGRQLAIEAAEAESAAAAEVERQALAAAETAGEHWSLAEWAIGILNQLDAAEGEVKARAKAHVEFLLGEARRRRAGLLWKLGGQIREQVDADLAGRKTKSVTYATGKAGYRKQAEHKSLIVDDEVAALAWAKVNCKTAVVESVARGVLSAHCKAMGEAPAGCHWETTPESNNFFIGPVVVERAQLPVPEPVEASVEQAPTPRRRATEFLTGGTPFAE